jgi:hypothetical protein
MAVGGCAAAVAPLACRRMRTSRDLDVAPQLPRPLPSSSGRPELLVLTSVRALAAFEVVLVHTLFELGGDWALLFRVRS